MGRWNNGEGLNYGKKEDEEIWGRRKGGWGKMKRTGSKKVNGLDQGGQGQ